MSLLGVSQNISDFLNSFVQTLPLNLRPLPRESECIPKAMIRKLISSMICLVFGCGDNVSDTAGKATSRPTLTLQQMAIQLLEAHDIGAHTNGDWIAIQGSEILTQWKLASERQVQAGQWSVQLDSLWVLEDRRLLVESVGGFGPSRSAAIVDALDNFSKSSFHVLLRALLDAPCDHALPAETWEISGTPRMVFPSDLVSRGKFPQDASEAVQEWCDLVVKEIQTSSLPNGTHWIRVYTAQMNDEVMQLEVLLDNEPWHEIKPRLIQIKPPAQKDFYSIRLFWVVRDSTNTTLPASTPLSNRQEE